MLKYYLTYLVIFSAIMIPIFLSCDAGFSANIEILKTWDITTWLKFGAMYLIIASAMFVVIGTLIGLCI